MKTEIKLVEELYGCQKFEIKEDGQSTQTITLVGENTEDHIKVIKILYAV